MKPGRDPEIDADSVDDAVEPPKNIGLTRFLTTSIVAFAALVLAWPIFGGAYDVAFREGANLLCSVFGIEDVRFEDNIAHMKGIALSQERNVAIYVKTKESATKDHFWIKPISTRHLGYVPSVIFLALLIAMPIPARRRFKALLFGGMLLYVFIAARVAILIAYEGSQQGGADVGERWTTTLHHLHGLLNQEPMIYSLVPALIWAAVAIRKEDLPRFLPGR